MFKENDSVPEKKKDVSIKINSKKFDWSSKTYK